MNAEAREDTNKVIKFITQVSHWISQFEDNIGEEDNKRHVKAVSYIGDTPAEDALGFEKEKTQEFASKTQGSLPGAQQTSFTEGAVNKPVTEAGGDKEGVQSISVAPGR
jgi:hypothetical protein